MTAPWLIPPPWLPPPPSSSSALVPITFPATPLNVKVELALGADLTAAPSTWGWTDATTLVYVRDKLTITRGRPDESAVADSAKLAFTADNRGGHWSSRNPNSPWFGLLRKGTPIRVSVEGFPRYSGFIAELPPRWDPSGRDRHAPVVAQGLLYRLGQGAAQEHSAMRRSYASLEPAVYWPLEDGPNATQAASGLIDGTPMSVTGNAGFGLVAGPLGSDKVVDLSQGVQLRADIPAVAGTTSYRIELSIEPSTLGASDFEAILQWTVPGGGIAFWELDVASLANGGLYVQWVDTAGGTDLYASNVDVADNAWHHVRLDVSQAGGSSNIKVYVDGTLAIDQTAAKTWSQARSLFINPTGGLNELVPSIGHLAVWTPWTGSADTYQAFLGYDGELAHTRFLRLCDEEGLPGATDVTDSQAMGPQGVDAIVPLLRECEASDQAFLFEDTAFGLYFQGHQERENQPALLQLDYDAEGHVSPPLEPTDDDQQARNDVEVKRDGGSSSRLTEEDPNVELSIPNIGRRSDSVTYSLSTDDQTRHLAGWRLHLATYPGYRYPTLSLNLAAGPDLIPDVCTAGLGFRTTIANPPDDIGPDAPSVIVEGYAETLGAFDWDLQANCSLQGPWEVAVLAADTGDTDPHLGWLDFDTLTLSADVDTDDVTWLVDADPVDTTNADDFPRDMLCEGELITVTACSGSSAPQSWTVTRSVNGIVKSHTAAVVITLAHPFVLAL